MSELNAIETIAKWRDELRPPQNLLNQVLDAARETFRLRAINAELLELLEWLDRLGGLGYDKHDRIRAAIARAKLTTT